MNPATPTAAQGSATAAVPPELPVHLAAYAEHARAVLPPAAWAYLNGGAADEVTLRANPAAWSRIGLRPRVLQPLAHGHTRVELFGRVWPHPIALAPLAYQRLFHPGGELASALAAAAQGAGFILSTQASTRLEDVAQAVSADAGRGALWFQLYLQGDRAADLDLLRRAEAAGYEALVLTVDAPCHGARDRERAAGFTLPAGVRAVNLCAPVGDAPALRHDESALFDRLLCHAPTWDDVAWLRAQTRLPLLLKGVTHPADAKQAQALGADGLIVSNHGGRTLDTVPPTAELLPAVADAVGAGLPLLVDGGIRRGTDVLKALALGARAVLIGRPYAWALAHRGAHGVAHVLRLLRDELEIAMALMGVRTLDALRRDHLQLLPPQPTQDPRWTD